MYRRSSASKRLLTALTKTEQFYSVLNSNIIITEPESKILSPFRTCGFVAKSLFVVMEARLQKDDLRFFDNVDQAILFGYTA